MHFTYVKQSAVFMKEDIDYLKYLISSEILMDKRIITKEKKIENFYD